jgi:hypothetical protein
MLSALRACDEVHMGGGRADLGDGCHIRCGFPLAPGILLATRTIS